MDGLLYCVSGFLGLSVIQTNSTWFNHAVENISYLYQSWPRKQGFIVPGSVTLIVAVSSNTAFPPSLLIESLYINQQVSLQVAFRPLTLLNLLFFIPVSSGKQTKVMCLHVSAPLLIPSFQPAPRPLTFSFFTCLAEINPDSNFHSKPSFNWTALPGSCRSTVSLNNALCYISIVIV